VKEMALKQKAPNDGKPEIVGDIAGRILKEREK
jgi:hypothetical protein